MKGIAQEIEVRPLGANRTADDESAKRSINKIAWNTLIPDNAVQLKVRKGWVTLSGKVEWQYQKTAAGGVVRVLAGVVGISNLIETKQCASAADVKKRIDDALRRSAEVEATAFRVHALDGGKVRLDGKVHAWSERSAAERAAWSAPSVNSAEDRIVVT